MKENERGVMEKIGGIEREREVYVGLWGNII